MVTQCIEHYESSCYLKPYRKKVHFGTTLVLIKSLQTQHAFQTHIRLLQNIQQIKRGQKSTQLINNNRKNKLFFKHQTTGSPTLSCIIHPTYFRQLSFRNTELYSFIHTISSSIQIALISGITSLKNSPHSDNGTRF